ncbi:MAG: phosphotransferase [Candidatus Omnitrophica bacterium]|nr:phosphotransferase [Candidatus Omnitrophota bacterium]
MTPNTGEPSYEKLSLIHRARSKTQADIWLVAIHPGEKAVLRDYSGEKHFLMRQLCRWALKREVHVHRLLEGVRGIPRLVAVLDRDRYLIEWIDGQPLSSFKKVQMPAPFFSDLENVMAEMHSRGVAHGDLRNRNIMVTSEGRPMVIDFSTAWWRTPLWRRPIFQFFKRLDDRRLAKSKQKFCPETLNEMEEKILESDPWYHRVGSIYRHWIYPKVKGREEKRN